MNSADINATKTPEGWTSKTLLELAQGKKELFDDGDWIESEHITTLGVRLVQTGNIGVGTFVEKDVRKYIYESSYYKLRCKPLATGDLLICRLADPAGRACVLPKIGEQKIVTSVDVTIFRPPAELADRIFLCNVFSTPEWFRAVAERSGGTTHKRISRGALGKLSVLLPPVKEQRAIAEALSDVDALLSGLDRLIAKKRDLKQAAMQQLLTGQTRLPGFHGEWVVTTFAQTVRHQSGNSTLIKGKLSAEPAVGLYPGFSASGQDVWCDHFDYEGDAVIVSAVGSRCGKAFMAAGRWCAIANTHVIWSIPSKIDLHFLGFFINDESFWLKSGSGQPFVLFKQTFAKTLRLPPIPEQTAIGQVLSDLDAELAVLEARREKTRQLKQGMMQELLTGRTRLV